jgi:hypothetical protein
MKLFSNIFLLALLTALLIESSPIFKFLRKNKGGLEKGTTAREEENTITTDDECLPNTEQMDAILVLGRSMIKNYDPSKEASYENRAISHYTRLVYHVYLISVEGL